MAKTQRITVGSNEQRIISLLWTGAQTELAYEVTLAKPGAQVQFLGLLIGQQAQNLALNIRVIHAAPQTTSEIVVKAALRDSARVDIDGMLRILPGAKGTTAWLGAHVLLSEDAKGQAIPGLEILENDVKAGHATTVGRINDLEVFYLMCRGLPEATARQLVVSGFLQDMINRLPSNLAAQAKKALIV